MYRYCMRRLLAVKRQFISQVFKRIAINLYHFFLSLLFAIGYFQLI